MLTTIGGFLAFLGAAGMAGAACASVFLGQPSPFFWWGLALVVLGFVLASSSSSKKK